MEWETTCDKTANKKIMYYSHHQNKCKSYIQPFVIMSTTILTQGLLKSDNLTSASGDITSKEPEARFSLVQKSKSLTI